MIYFWHAPNGPSFSRPHVFFLPQRETPVTVIVVCRKFFPSPGWSPICTGKSKRAGFHTGYLPGSDRCFLDPHPCGWIIPNTTRYNKLPLSPEEIRKTLRSYVAFCFKELVSVSCFVYIVGKLKLIWTSEMLDERVVSSWVCLKIYIHIYIWVYIVHTYIYVCLYTVDITFFALSSVVFPFLSHISECIVVTFSNLSINDIEW